MLVWLCVQAATRTSPSQEFIQCDLFAQHHRIHQHCSLRSTQCVIWFAFALLRTVFIAANYSLSDAFSHILSFSLLCCLSVQLRCISFAKFIFLVKTENGIRRVRCWYVVCVGRQMIIWVIAAIAWEWKRHQMNNDNKIWKSFASSWEFAVSVPVAIGTAAATEWNGSH